MEATEKTKEKKVLQAMAKLAKKLRQSELKAIKLKGTKTLQKIIASYLGVSENQAIIFTVIFSEKMDDTRDIDITDICCYLGISYLEMLDFKDDFDLLIEKRFVETDHTRWIHSKLPFKKFVFSIPDSIQESIFENEPIKALEPKAAMDIYGFVNLVSDLIEKRKDNDLTTRELFEEFSFVEKSNESLKMIQQTKLMRLDVEDKILLYEICDDKLQSGRSGLECTLADIYDDVRTRFNYMRKLKENTSRLIELDLIKLSTRSFMSDATLELTSKGLELFLEEDAVLFEKKSSEKLLIDPEKISAKELFFDKELMQQVQFVQNSLSNENFVNMQNRLDNMGMPKGIAAIFYGAPGTGKTESVYQLAKSTGRSIMHVDISETKSMWFGESEKKIKEVFSNYSRLCEKSEIKPILLFNEADAVFGKRKDSNASNVAQTENAIQNIILEEMEKLDGILIATTNINQNLDAAFERRFLFKIKFEKQSTEAKQKIWQSKLPWLENSLASQLASNFSFSGGEIDNIVRKITMEEVLTGVKPEGDQIIKFCKSENFSNNEGRGKLGF